ncbi:MAG: PEP-CTERM sorting domain-containing protein, partial [Phycisphaerae bacterium]
NGSQREQEFFMFSQSHFTILFAAAAVAALGATVSTASATNLILNGDFSANASAYTASYGVDGASGNPTAPSSWTSVAPVNYGGLGVNGPDTTVGTPTAPGLGNNVLPPASSTGSQDFAWIQGGLTNSGAFSPASFTQNFATVAGEKYVVTFVAAQGGNNGSGAGDTGAVLQVQAIDSVNNVLATATTDTGGGLNAINATGWTNEVFNFTASTTSTTLAFADAPNSAVSQIVDFTNVAAAVPEPASLGLFAIGGLGMLLIGRKRVVRKTA